jgi:hypothetical protein
MRKDVGNAVDLAIDAGETRLKMESTVSMDREASGYS